MNISHESEKKRRFISRVLNVENAAFTPLVLSTTVGKGREAELFFKKKLQISNTTRVTLMLSPTSEKDKYLNC